MEFDLSQIELNKKDLEKGLKLPTKMSKELAELVGIHFGDGRMSKDINYTYVIDCTLNRRDIQYAEYVKELFYKIFNINMKVYKSKSKNDVVLYINSKALCIFFNKNLEVPYSPKKDLSIPQYIGENKEYAQCFLRGLFDTDGCTVVQKFGKYRYDLIKITTSIYTFAQEIKSLLSSLGIRCYISSKNNYTGHDVTIRRKESFKKFIHLIKPKNKKKSGDAEIRTQIHRYQPG